MAKREVINPPGLWPRPIRSTAVRVGDLIWTAGMAGDDPKTGKVEGDIKQQTRQVLENLKLVLEASGSSLASVIKINIHLTDVANRAGLNEVYREFFPPESEPPARMSVGGAVIDPGILIEIEAVAAVES